MLISYFFSDLIARAHVFLPRDAQRASAIFCLSVRLFVTLVISASERLNALHIHQYCSVIHAEHGGEIWTESFSTEALNTNKIDILYVTLSELAHVTNQ